MNMEYYFKVGERIQLSGGYDYDILYLKNPPADKRSGIIIKFIIGQNENPALVAQLDTKISGTKITGNIVVLEIRQGGVTWHHKSLAVHIELCDFIPENKAWKDRKQGEWVEAAATLTKLNH